MRWKIVCWVCEYKVRQLSGNVGRMKILWRRVGMFGSEHLGLDDELDKIGGDSIVS